MSKPTEPTKFSLIGIEEVARRLDISERTAARLADRGRIPASIRVGGGRKWVAEEVDAFIKNRGRMPAVAG